jgi:RimJ/RimL family protein N-acetyltransferase
MSVTVRMVEAGDHADWARLYAGYADFYKVTQSDAMRATVWAWLHDPTCEVEGLVAVDADDKVIGISHFRPYRRPLSASIGGFLDDLFVDPDARGSGAAQALIAGVEAIGRTRGWSVIRWITAADNTRARVVYDRLATATPWVTYDIKL